MKATVKKPGFGYAVGEIVDVVRDIDANTLYVKSAQRARAIQKSAVRLIKEVK